MSVDDLNARLRVLCDQRDTLLSALKDVDREIYEIEQRLTYLTEEPPHAKEITQCPA